MKKITGQGEEGFVLVWALLLIVVLVLLGTFGINTSIFESKMAANNALYKQAFYRTDGGTEVGLNLLRQNINCISGFQAGSFPVAGGGDGDIAFTGDLNFWVNNNDPEGVGAASDANRDLFYPWNYTAAGQPPMHTNVRISGRFVKGEGEASIGLGGYEGLGTNVAQSTATGLLFEINGHYVGERNTEVAICSQYMVDSQFARSPSGDCLY